MMKTLIDKRHYLVRAVTWWKPALVAFLMTLVQVTLAFDNYRQGGVNFRLNVNHGLADVDTVLTLYNVTIDDSVHDYLTFFGSFPDSIDVETVVEELLNHSAILWAEPDFFIQEATTDEFYEEEWYLEPLRPTGLPWASVHAHGAWAIDTGSCEIRVGIIDTGIPWNQETEEFTHEDLRNENGSCFIVPGRVPSQPNQDLNDVRPHGTKVAGVLGARANNATGIAGIARGITMVVYKYPTLTVSDVVTRIYDAIDPLRGNVAILSLSWTCVEGDVQALRDAVQASWDNDILLVAAADNRHPPGLDDDPRFPCAYSDEFDNVLCVGGTNDNSPSYYAGSYLWIKVRRWDNPNGG